MRTLIYILITLITALFFSGCNNSQSLQEYFVENAGNGQFISFDIPASVLNVTEASLTPEQKEAYQSVKKLNVLAFKINENNKDVFEAEKAKIQSILADDDYQELMRINTGKAKGVVKYLGDDDAIDEVILFGSDNAYGLALIRVLGNDMKVENLGQLMEIIQKSNIDKEGLGQLGNLFNAK